MSAKSEAIANCRSQIGRYEQSIPVFTVASRWRPSSGECSVTRRMTSRTRRVTATRARSALLVHDQRHREVTNPSIPIASGLLQLETGAGGERLSFPERAGPGWGEAPQLSS